MLQGTPRVFVGTTTFVVRGATSAFSRRLIEELVAAIEGVASVTVDPTSGTVTVTASGLVDRADIAAAVAAGGFTLVP